LGWFSGIFFYITQKFFHNLIYIQIGGIDDNGITGRPQRPDRSVLIASVPLFNGPSYLLKAFADAFSPQFSLSSSCPLNGLRTNLNGPQSLC
jgi:hypothetical protein